MNKLISIVIPTYNAQNTIKECINSIKSKDSEIIIVVDGATDNTLEICNKIKNRNLKIINQENKGAFEARKTGIENSTGKYIMFLDADDKYKSNTVYKMKEMIEKYNEPDLIRFRYESTPNGYEQYKYIKDEKEILQKDFQVDIYPMFLDGYMLNSIWTNCVKKEILQNINNIEQKNIKYGEDLLLNLEIFSNIKNVIFINDILYEYTYQENSITHLKSIDRLMNNLKDAIEVYSLLHEYLLKWNMYNEENVEIVNNRIKKESNKILEIIKEEIKNNCFNT